MKTLAYKYSNNKGLFEFIEKNNLWKQKNVLIQVFSWIIDKDKILEIRESLKEKIPFCKIIWATTAWEIYKNNADINSIVISFSIFEKTKLKSLVVSWEKVKTSSWIGKEIAKELVDKDTKLLIVFWDWLNINWEDFIKWIQSVNNEVTISWGLAWDNSMFKETFVFDSENITSNWAVWVALNSKDLKVFTKKNFDFVWVWKYLTVTKAKWNVIYEIDWINATEVYWKYLWEEIAKKLPAVWIEFPLVIENNWEKVARAVLWKWEKWSLKFAWNVKTWDKVQFAFGNAQMILDSAWKLYDHFCEKNIESFFVYSCMARINLMPQLIHLEIEPLQKNAETVGFFTYWEFFHSNNENNLFNQTMTIVWLSESNLEKKSGKFCDIEKNKLSPSSHSQTMKALSHLINETTSELYLLNNKLNSSAKEATQLKNFIKKIFDTQSNITIISSKKEMKMIDANAQFFKIFKFKNVKEFLEKCWCICELFVEKNWFLRKYNNWVYWIDYISKNPKKAHIAVFNIWWRERTFSVKLKNVHWENSDLFIISLSETTAIVNLNEKLNTSIEKEKKLKNFIQKVIESQSDAIAVIDTNEKKVLKYANKPFFRLFSIKDLNDFKWKYSCIFDIFEERKWYLLKELKNENWVNYLIKNKNKENKVLQKRNNKEKIFSIKVKKIERQSSLFIISFYDVTKIENLNKNLEKLVEERTKDLMKSYEKLKELDKMKDHFISIVSHELRTPMTIIKTYTSLLIEKAFWNLNEKQIWFLEKVYKNTWSLIDLVNDILDISKLESWKTDFNYEKLKILKFTNEQVKDFEILYKKQKKKIILKNNLKEEIFIKTDKKRLERVFTNLLSNALKFTEKWKWKVVVKLSMENNEKYIKVSVIDNWIWISKEKQKMIFEKFSQVDWHLQRSHEWTWLWLSIVRSIIRIMWWKIQVESVLWKWSNFSFTLPISKK